MSAEKTFWVVRESFNDLFRRPGILVAGFLLYVVLFLFSTFGGTIAGRFQTTGGNIAWTILFGVIAVSLISFIFSGMIALVRGKDTFALSGRKFWKRNFVLIVIILALSFAVGRIAHFGALFVGRIFGMGLVSAQIFFVFIYFIGLVGVLIFLTYASFFVVFDNLSVAGSLKKSKKFVVKNYLETLGVLVGLFVLGYFLDMVPGILGDFVTYVLLLPFSILVLGRMVLRPGEGATSQKDDSGEPQHALKKEGK